MIRSMTGFGSAEAAVGAGQLRVEVRTVNARHCDVRVRAPREVASLESDIRSQATRSFSRGTVEVTLRFVSGRAGESRVDVDREVVKGYARAVQEIAAETELPLSLQAGALLSLPGVVRLSEPELDLEQIAPDLLSCVERACVETVEMRKREGEALAEELRARSDGLAETLSQIERRADEVKGSLRARLEKRLGALVSEIALDPGRLEQEVVFYADRMDVTEETVRFRSHLAQFHETLERDGAVGRRLEFILQELTRETNTIGSKAADAPIAAAVVELKTELEKLREQVLNVE